MVEALEKNQEEKRKLKPQLGFCSGDVSGVDTWKKGGRKNLRVVWWCGVVEGQNSDDELDEAEDGRNQAIDRRDGWRREKLNKKGRADL